MLRDTKPKSRKMEPSYLADQEKGNDVKVSNNDSTDSIQDGDIHYSVTEGTNSGTATYQDARGAPVEVQSPLGYSVNSWVSLCLNVNQMVGTGIFSTVKMIHLPLFSMCFVLTMITHKSPPRS